MELALAGIKVLDLTRVLAGPFATMILGDLGADIIKVERPDSGDDSRQFGPYKNGESAYFISINRNKRSIGIDLKHNLGKQLIFDLVRNVDIIVENFRPGTMEKLGLGYEELKVHNPQLIYAAISGFGHTGPYSQKPAYDGIVQAMGGIMSITGEKNGTPTRVGPSLGDLAAGLYGTIGVLAALQQRHKTGLGQKVDVAMLDCQVSLLENAIARYVVSGEIPRPSGNRHNFIVPFEPFATEDGELMLAIGNDKLWQKFCSIIDRDELANDERFSDMEGRNINYVALRPILANIFAARDTEFWVELLNSAGIPNGPINTIDKVINDPHIKAREMIIEMDQPAAGKIKVPGIPIKLSDTPGSIRMPAPAIGEHTGELLSELLGYDENKVRALKETGAIK